MAEIYFARITLSDTKSNNAAKASDYGRALIKKIAAKKLCVAEETLIFAENKNGKPYFKDIPDFYFNISHSGDGIAVAVDNKEIGIDIECVRKVDLRVARRFFTESEQEYIFNTEDSAELRFFEIWTKKEAYIKKYGLNLGDLCSAKTENIYTICYENFIISVCGEFDSVPVLIKV